jgi:hypothetical protein
MKKVTITKVPLLFVLSLFLPDVLCAEDPVHFADAHLKAAVESKLWVSDPTPTDMLALTSLEAGSLGIADLTGLEYATNLRTLWLRLNYITDISPLSGLTELEYLVLHRNALGDLSPLSGLTKLTYLDLNTTNTSDISALSGLTNLRELDLFCNQIHDVSALVGLTSLTWLNLLENPLTEEAYTVQIPQIIANNPGALVRHNRGPYRLTLSSTAGGSVIHPGEGEFVFGDGNPVYVEAKADPGFVFAGFSGSYSTQVNPFDFMMGQDNWIRANFLSLSDVLYVDDDGPCDPGPGDTKISDPSENGTLEHPFDGIQEVVEVAAEGTTVFVRPGVYRESIDFLAKSLRLIGIEADDPASIAWPILDGCGTHTVVSFTHGDDPNTLLQGFVITRGRGSLAGAIGCVGSSPTIADCLIVGNRATDAVGAAIYCVNSNAQLISCTLADNHAGPAGAGISLVDSSVTLTNSILWGDAPQEIRLSGVSDASIRYSDVAGGWPGPGNMDANPLFAREGYWVDRDQPGLLVGPDYINAIWVLGDSHLCSQAGRWDPRTAAWIQDDATSPCIDAGDPDSAVGAEPVPNGGILNIGAYGGTAQASKSGQ